MTTLDEALALARLGYPVVPLHGVVSREPPVCSCSRGPECGRSTGKHPRLASWQREATTDEEMIRRWPWAEPANLGIATGRGLVVLDFDGEEGLRTLRALLEALPPLDATTPYVETGSGGVHIYLRDDPARPASSGARILPGMDVRGRGGQVVAPPSQHYSGGVYRWLSGPSSLDDLPPTPPEWQAVARGETPSGFASDAPGVEDIRAIKGRFRATIKRALDGDPLAKPGARDKTMVSVAGLLASRWPKAPAEALAAPFCSSFEAMAREAEGAPAFEKFVERISKFQLQQRENLRAGRTIQIGVDIEEMADAAIGALAETHRELGVYRFGDRLAEVKGPAGDFSARLQVVETDALRGLLTVAARWVRITEEGPRPAYPPDQVVRRVLTKPPWPGVSRVSGVSADYILRPDGSFWARGYDEMTRVFCFGKEPPDPLDAGDALGRLRDVIADFPFEDLESESVWLASVLSGVALDVYQGSTPGFLIDANTLGAGKTKLAQIAGVIASGSPPKILDISSNDEEVQKVITASAISGDRYLLVDNVVGRFGTASLAKALTLGDAPWSGRILGKSKTWSGPFRPIWWVTSNNATLQHDLSRRFLRCRLRSDVEDPRRRTDFRHPNLEVFVRENQRELRLAAMSILRAFIVAGKPQPEKSEPMGSFEDWAELVRGALVWIGYPDPVVTVRELEALDETNDGLGVLLEVLEEAFGGESFRTRDVIERGWADGTNRELAEAVADVYAGARRGIPSSRGLGRAFLRLRDKIVGGRRLRKEPGRRSVSAWRIERMG